MPWLPQRQRKQISSKSVARGMSGISEYSGRREPSFNRSKVTLLLLLQNGHSLCRTRKLRFTATDRNIPGLPQRQGKVIRETDSASETSRSKLIALQCCLIVCCIGFLFSSIRQKWLGKEAGQREDCWLQREQAVDALTNALATLEQAAKKFAPMLRVAIRDRTGGRQAGNDIQRRTGPNGAA